MPYPPAAEQAQSHQIINPGLASIYGQWFEVIPADTAELQAKAYRLRYQVYCCEHRYETPDEHPLHLETDEFDARSIHSLLLDRTTGSAMGTVRLILSDEEAPQARLPIHQLCGHRLPKDLRMTNAAEISRFAISKQLRGISDEGCPRELKCSLVLGLMKAVVQMSMEYGVTDWLAVMEPSLLRLLARFSVHFAPIGPLVEYHGMRQPCHANVSDLLETVYHKHRPLYEFVTEPASWPAHTKPAAGF